tara:strand:- start:2136 stop:3551 length:1416 start_codon:yes stop_codon:yes gene_type:complete
MYDCSSKVVRINSDEIWSEISTFASVYLTSGTPLFRDPYYSLWVRTSGTHSIAITKAGPSVDYLPPVENDGHRITTFHIDIGHIIEFLGEYYSLSEAEYDYKHWAYKMLTRKIVNSDEDSITKEILKIQILSLISEIPMKMSDFREIISLNAKDIISEYDNEKTGHGRERWKTNLQNAIGDLKSDGKIGHLKWNQYISPIACSNPLEPTSFWLDILENSKAKYSDEAVCEWEHDKHGHGTYFIQSASSNQIKFRRFPVSGEKKIDAITFDKKRVIGMANSLNAVGGKGTRVTIGGNREVYSELLVALSSSIEFKEDKWVEITDTVVDPSSNFIIEDLNLDKDLRKRTLKPGIQREGATRFRKKVLENYGNKCAITGTSVADTLQAAHIRPYNGPLTNHPANGISLRSDIHRLFDLGKIRINPEDYHIFLHPEIESEYRSICYDKLNLSNVLIPPDKAALELMWQFEKNMWF